MDSEVMVHIVFNVHAVGQSIHAVFGDELLALREAHKPELPRGVKRRVIESYPADKALAIVGSA